MKYIRIIGVVMVLLSIGLIIREIIQFNNLQSITDPICTVVDFSKYKQDTILLFFIWVLLGIFGIGLIKLNFYGWIIPQTLLIFGLVNFTLIMVFDDNSKWNLVNIVMIVSFLSISYVLFYLFNRNILLEYFNVKKSGRMLLYILSVIVV
jgi:hypothetical protein